MSVKHFCDSCQEEMINPKEVGIWGVIEEKFTQDKGFVPMEVNREFCGKCSNEIKETIKRIKK